VTPGVAPVLRPRTVGDRIGSSFRLWGANFAPLLPATALLAVVLGTVMALLSAWESANLLDASHALVVRDAFGATTLHWANLRFTATATALSALAGVLVTIPVVAIAYRRYAESFQGIASSWRGVLGGLRGIVPVLWIVALINAVELAAGLVVAVLALSFARLHVGVLGWVLVGLYAPALYAGWIWFSVLTRFSLPALMFEGARGTSALRRSWRLVRGAWWPLFGMILLFGLIIGAITLAATVVANLVTAITVSSGGPALHAFVRTFVLQLASLVVVVPLSCAFVTVLYVDLRVRREGLDLMTLTQGRAASAPAGTFDFIEQAPPEHLVAPPPRRGPEPPRPFV